MKSTSLLVTTKFAPPRVSLNSILREDLATQLQHAQYSKVILVCGGAGFGKTTVLAQWRQDLIKQGVCVGWLSLTLEDGAFALFCASLIGALQQVGLPLADDLLLLGDSDDSDDLLSLASVLINAVAQLDNELYLMLDDFHQVNSPRANQLVQALIDNAPANLHFVIASRVAPSLLLGRLRAMGQLCEITGNELSFNFRESLAFLKAHLDAEIDLEAAHSIHAQTDGWPIGLQLMAISLKSVPRKRSNSGVLATNSADLSAYLSEDVIANLPEGLIEFLQQISILRRFNADLAAHLSGCNEAAQHIANIEALNLFVLPVDMEDRYQWYRLHPMFAEFLLQKLQHSGADVRALHQRAAHWFASQDLVIEALRHALLSEDFDTVVQLLEHSLQPLTNIRHLGTFLRWIEKVPIALLPQHPRLALFGAWGYALSARLEQSERWLTLLERSTQDPKYAIHACLVKAMIAGQQDDSERSLLAIDALTDTPLRNPMLENFRLGLVIGNQAMLGNYALARATFRTLNLASTDEPALIARSSMAVAAFLEGKILEAERHAAPMLSLAEAAHGRRSITACTCAAILAEVQYEQNRIDDAREILVNRLDMLSFSVPACSYSAALVHARLQLLQETPRAALDYLDKRADHFRARRLDRGIALMLAEQIRIEVLGEEWKHGDWRHGQMLQSELDELASHHQGEKARDREIVAAAALSRARLARASQLPEQGLVALENVFCIGQALGRGTLLVKANLLKAQALTDLGRDNEARSCLIQVLQDSYSLGLFRTLLDEGDDACVLLANLKDVPGKALEVFQQQLSAQISGQIPSATSTATGVSSVAGDIALTNREEDILALLEQSMPNKRIARTLNISDQTVKWNLRNIFMKFGVSSRYEAIIIARKRANRSDTQ
ncbi:LuxR C-terminal-related transcriptional regulator [Pseudomonas sp. DG56-2]|uniref:LuxR C-terminal-related transcriptional regulator n=1 Tax=Pseudomonas sp. DG56-2 TaxID=2320270 RepID=UPI0010A5ADE7|nr:LuxR C-terminal-related transcriptional regulator [Pseudomonas sp. DG56-2]